MRQISYRRHVLGLLWDLISPEVALGRLGQRKLKLLLEDKLPHFNKTNNELILHNSLFIGLLIASGSTGSHNITVWHP